MDLGIVLGLLGVALTIGFGVGTLVQARRSTRRTQSGHQALLGRIDTLTRATLGPTETKPGDDPRLRYAAVVYADVFNEGESLMLVQHYTGAHATLLRVYGWRDMDFRLLAKLGTGTPEGFTVGDLDGDGRIEVATVDTDWDRTQSLDLSYADGVRMELLYRWNGNEFEEIGRRLLPLPSETRERTLNWHVDPLTVPADGSGD